MQLDKRIKSKEDILTCFDIEKAGQFLGHKGYFANVNSSYQNLDNKAYGILTEIKDAAYSFKMDNNEYWRFFIPESRVEPIEKIDEISVLKYKVEKLEKNLIELQRELNNQKTIYNPFTPWTNCCASINYSDGFNPHANCCSNNERS